MHYDPAVSIIMFKLQMHQDVNNSEGLRDREASIHLSGVFSP